MNFRTALLALSLTTLGFVGSAEAQGLAQRTQPNRDGLYLQGGAWFNAGADSRPWFRAEVGLHLRRMNRSDLYLQLPFMVTRRAYNWPGSDYWRWTGLALVPGVRGEWTLLNRKGDLAMFLEGGAGIVMLSYRQDFAGDRYSDTYISGIMRAGAGIVYTAPFGLMVNFQPAGFDVYIGSESVYNQGAYYEGSFMLGYRWE